MQFSVWNCDTLIHTRLASPVSHRKYRIPTAASPTVFSIYLTWPVLTAVYFISCRTSQFSWRRARYLHINWLVRRPRSRILLQRNLRFAERWIKCILVRRSGRGTVHYRPFKIFLHYHQLWTLLSKIREGVALSPLRIFYKTHLYAN